MGGTTECNVAGASPVQSSFHASSVVNDAPIDWSGVQTSGGTAEGGHSNQIFGESYESFPTETYPVVIDIWLKGQPTYIDSVSWTLQYVNGVLIPHQNGVPCHTYKRYIQCSDGTLTVEF